MCVCCCCVVVCCVLCVCVVQMWKARVHALHLCGPSIGGSLLAVDSEGNNALHRCALKHILTKQARMLPPLLSRRFELMKNKSG